MDVAGISFKGKVGIITGAAQGIGKAVAKQFVEMGGKAVIVDINQKTSAETCAELGNAVYYTADLSKADDITRTFAQIISEQKKIDVLINCAGIVSTADFEKLTLDEWNRVLAVDLTAVFITCQIMLKHMAENGGGRIVNISSVAAKVGGGYLGTAAYAAAKAGVICLTKSVAKAGSPKNVYCNSVCPSYTKTPMTQILTEEQAKAALGSISLHRPAAPAESAAPILFLASDAASYIQGENIICDGGLLMNG